MWRIGVFNCIRLTVSRPHPAGGTHVVESGRAHVPSQVFTFPGLALTHFSAAFSGSMC